MSKIDLPKILLLTKNFVYIVEIYGLVLNDNLKNFTAYFLNIFAEKGLGTFLVTLYETFSNTFGSEKFRKVPLRQM